MGLLSIRTDNDGDNQCNIGGANTDTTDTVAAPLSIGGIPGTGGVAASAATVELTASTEADFLCYTSTGGVSQIVNDIFELGVYPNPNNGQFKLVMNLESHSSSQFIRIYNMSGQLMQSQQIPGSGKMTVAVDLGDVPAGMYYVQVLRDSNVATKKVIIY